MPGLLACPSILIAAVYRMSNGDANALEIEAPRDEHCTGCSIAYLAIP